MTTTAKPDVYQAVTDRIIESLETAGQWKMPWYTLGQSALSPINVQSRKAYRGVNIPMLWLSADRHSYSHGLWGTYKQWQDLGAQVLKGEKSTMVVFWKAFSEENEDGEEVKSGMFAKGYAVFNVAQVDGYTIPAADTLPTAEHKRIENAETYFRNTRAIIRHGGDSAFYRPDADFIQMPELRQFREVEGYYATLAHEVTHWTNHASRLDRLNSRFVDKQDRALEEMVAELGAAYTCAKLGLSLEPRTDHASYIASWLSALKHDKKFFFRAASMAQKASDYLDNLQSAPAMSAVA